MSCCCTTVSEFGMQFAESATECLNLLDFILLCIFFGTDVLERSRELNISSQARGGER